MSDPKKASPTDFNLTVSENIGYGEAAAGPIAPQATDLLSLGYTGATEGTPDKVLSGISVPIRAKISLRRQRGR